MEDLHKAGGIPALVKYLLKNTDLIDGTQLTVTGKTLAENYEDVPELDFNTQDVVKRIETPIKKVVLESSYTFDLYPDARYLIYLPDWPLDHPSRKPCSRNRCC